MKRCKKAGGLGSPQLKKESLKKMADFKNMVFIDPMDNVIVGGLRICQYVGVSSFTTLIVWSEVYGFPMVKRPDGLWMSSCTAIDSWIFMASQAENENRAYSRGTNLRADLALEKAKKRAARSKARMQEGPTISAAKPGPAMSTRESENGQA